MQISELLRDQVTPAQRPSQPLDPHALLSQLGCEVARTLSSALERVTTLAATGRIDRSSLQALRDEVDRARRAGIMGQQVSRFASGRVQVASERLDLTGLLLEALRQRRREIEAKGSEVRQFFAQTEVMSDATLTFSLLHSLFDWALEHAVSRIDLKLDIKPWPTHARLTCAFSHRPPDSRTAGDSAWLDNEASPLETMSWCLLQQTAVALGLVIYRHDTASRTTLTLEFPETVVSRIAGLSTRELDDPSQNAHNSQPLAGRHALVVASRREVRGLVRDALRPMGLMIDFVNSVEEAVEFCRDGLPHAVVYEAALAGDRFEKLRADMLAEVPAMAFVQIAEHGKAFEVLNLGSHQFASVGRDALLESLPAAMMFELARSDSGAHP
jgi:CheY-like chemotaxis protein/DNA-binding transcriptional regulator YdaS (Cro superfamily)